MSDDNQDIFGKIDALLEKHAGFGAEDGFRPLDDDFPLLTEVVEGGTAASSTSDRRQSDRRLGMERRQFERRKPFAEFSGATNPAFTDEQFSRFLDVFEQKLEDLFIRQQLRMEESIRRAIREEKDKPRGG